MSKLRDEITAEDHVLGNADAEYTLVEYGDYECPHCAAAQGVVERVREHFGSRLRFVFRNFPLTQIHVNAESAAEAAEFAATQGKFWEMHDLLFDNQEQLGEELYEELARDLALEPVELRQALEESTFIQRIRLDFSGGVRSGVNGTPTFFVNGQRHNGPANFEALVESINAALTS
jgi:protein-disulfide isomerase